MPVSSARRIPTRTASTLTFPRIAAGAGVATALALWNIWAARTAERKHPPRGRFITVESDRLHYIERGAGSPVVLVHGNVVTAEDFVLSGLFDLLAKRYRVIAFDRPGYGYSTRSRGSAATPAAQARLLRRAFHELGIERPVVLGHSFGAIVALALAMGRPETVRGLVLISGYYYPTVRADIMLSKPLATPIVGDLMRFTISPLLGRLILPLILKAMFAPAALPRRFADGFARGFPVRPGQLRAEAQDGAGMARAVRPLQHRFRELTMPLAIIAGSEDRVVSIDRHAEQLHRAIPGSVLRRVKDAGHMVHHQTPQQIADIVDDIERALKEKTERAQYQYGAMA